jgi:methionyl-tRNA synthetase
LPIAEGKAQVRHAPWQASPQQTPSTQKVLAHSAPFMQACPVCLRPQLPSTQACPAWQSASVVQVESHALTEHLKGAHTCTPGARQTPLPLHVPAVARRSPAHAGGMQTVSAT